jgi:hypothetical protein
MSTSEGEESLRGGILRDQCREAVYVAATDG